MKRVKDMFTLFQKLQESKTLAKKDRDKLRWVLAPVLNCYLIVEQIQDLESKFSWFSDLSYFLFQSCSSVAGFLSALKNCSPSCEKHQNVKKLNAAKQL